MADAEMSMRQLRDMQDELPEEERKGNMGKILSYVMDLAQGGWSVREAYQNLGKLSAVDQHLDKLERILEGKVEELAKNGKEAILQALDYQLKNCTEEIKAHYYDCLDLSLEEFYTDVAQDKITQHEKTKKMILDSMRQYHKNQSNQMIKDMVRGSAYVAAFQLMKIYIAWKKISAASNVIENPNKFVMIKNNMQRMESMVAELVELCAMNPTDRSINRKMVSINTLFMKTLKMISDLKVTINGHIQSLDLLADYAAVDGVVNLATAASQGWQLWYTWSNLTRYTKSLGVASVALFTSIAYGNYRTFQLSREAIKELQKNLNEAILLQEILEDLHDQADQAFNAIQY